MQNMFSPMNLAGTDKSSTSLGNLAYWMQKFLNKLSKQ